MVRARSSPRRARAERPAENRRDGSAAVLQLQRTAGNRAVARLLQRVPVTGTVTQNPEQTHHPFYRFRYPGEAEDKLFDLDKWITSKLASPAAALKVAQPGTAATVLTAVQNWDGSSSIVDALVDALIAATPVADWKAADIQANVLASEYGQSLVGLLLSLKANIQMRDDDIPNNVPRKMRIKGAPKVVTKKSQPTDEKKTIDWKPVLKDARVALKTRMTAPQPTWVPARKEEVRLIDDAVAASQDAALAELRRIGALGRKKPTDMIRFDATPHTGKGGTVVNYTVEHEPDVEFNFGLNHLRFIVFMEWKLLTELMKPQQ